MRHEIQTVRIGARGSKLSRVQLETVVRALQEVWPHLQIITEIFQTSGDRDQKSPLPEIGSKGLFTAELEAALHQNQIDLAVHSQKDLPIQNPTGLCLGAIYTRDSHQDALVSSKGYRLKNLPHGARIGTSSARRKAQLLRLRPDLEILSLRGNVDTRLRKSPDYDAIVLAHAGLLRLGLETHVSEVISTVDMLPAPAQGALAIQCRAETQWLELLKPLNHSTTEACTLAERSFLAGLGGGCSLPISAFATMQKGQIHLEGEVLSPDGQTCIRESMTGQDPKKIGLELARRCLNLGANNLLNALQNGEIS